jgi:hypothetical protein
MVIDGFMIGVLRGGPNAFLTDWSFDPYLNATFYTWLEMWQDTWSNGLFNGIEAGVTAVLAHRVAVSVVPSLGAGRVKAGRAAPDPFAEPSESPEAAAAAEPATAPAAPAESPAATTDGGTA